MDHRSRSIDRAIPPSTPDASLQAEHDERAGVRERGPPRRDGTRRPASRKRMPAPAVSATSGRRAAPGGEPCGAGRGDGGAGLDEGDRAARARRAARAARPERAAPAACSASTSGAITGRRRASSSASSGPRRAASRRSVGRRCRASRRRAAGWRWRRRRRERPQRVAVVAAQQGDHERAAGPRDRAGTLARQAAGDHGDAAAQLLGAGGGQRRQRAAIAARRRAGPARTRPPRRRGRPARAAAGARRPVRAAARRGRSRCAGPRIEP